MIAAAGPRSAHGVGVGLAIRSIGSGPAALVSMVGPLLTLVFAWALLDEVFSTAQIFGAAMVVAGGGHSEPTIDAG